MFIAGELLGLDRFDLEVCKVVVIQGKLTLQCLVGDPRGLLPPGHDLGSACGSQKVMSMAWSRVMAVDSSGRACSPLPCLSCDRACRCVSMGPALSCRFPAPLILASG